MTGWRDPESLVRELSEEVVPPEPAEAAQARRERVVPTLSRAIRESAIATQRRRNRRRWLAIGSVAATLLLAIGVVVRSAEAPVAAQAPAKASSVARIQNVTGTLVVTHGGRARVVGEGEQEELTAGDEMRTAVDGGAEFKTERSAVRVAPATQLSVLAPSSAEERIRLGVGRVELSVSKQPRSPRSVVVETPNADVVVRGTKFSVAVDRDGAKTTTRVQVREGSVWVVHGGSRDLVTAGEEWFSAAPPRASAPKPSTPIEVALAPEKARKAAPRGRAPLQPAAEQDGTLADENRMFQSAVDARNRGDDRRAAELFAGLLGRYPKSRLAEEARIERMRALKRSGESKRAAAEARRYLADHAGGFARDEARANALIEK